ncbi:hypothetical protein [Larkinella rosea]|uniref:DUF2306 domain-containing protein n=1 Tax=Larkinella rosea TaxID=2025312 RepID=A0A3P1C1K4_9BACT|nr:hypothetical protein [Larkinella rosea]RRB07311.1 hypothetical protein EHT25_05920 [Larkinella rosea]
MQPNRPKIRPKPPRRVSEKKPATIKLDRFLYRNATFGFAFFFAFAIWAFWPKYFSHVLDQPNVRFHTHGISMTLWCLMLIGQAYLIRTNRKALHRLVGKFSYLLVPLIIITSVNIVHFRMHQRGLEALRTYFSLALTLNSVIAFAVLYGLAMYYRHQPLIHARYLVSTIFPLFTPITDRLIGAHFKPILPFLPTLEGRPISAVLGFALADLLLLILLVWDWRTNRRLTVFAIALGVVLLYHVSTLTFYRFSFWRAFGVWFYNLPLS